MHLTSGINLSKFRWPFREDKSFSILAFLVLAAPLAFDIFSNENFETIKYVLWLVLLGWATIIYLKDRAKPLKFKSNKPLLIILGSFLFLAALSTVFSLDRLFSLFGFYYRFTSSLLFYLVLALFLALLVSILDRERFVFLTKILVFDSFFIAVIGFMQSLGIAFYQGLDVSGFIRAPSLLGNPNFSTMFMVAVLPYACLLFAQSKRFSAKLYYGLAVFFIILTNVILASRGALLALLASAIVGVGLVFWYRFGKKTARALGLGLLGIVIALGVVVISRPEIIKSTVNFSDANITTRLAVWKLSLSGIKERPVLGSGPGTFALFFEQARDLRLAQQGIGVFDDPHNLFLQMGETAGLPFLFSFLALVALALYYAWCRIRTRDLWALSSFVSVIAFLVAASFTPVAIPCFLLLAVVIAGQMYPQSREYSISVSRWQQIAGMLGGLALVIFGLSLFVSEHLFTLGYQAYFDRNYAKAYALSDWSVKINPTNRLYNVYRTGSEIMLGRRSEDIFKHIGQVRQLHPSFTRSLASASSLDYLYYRQTQDSVLLKQSITDLQASLKIDPYNPDRYALLGLYYFQLGNQDEAEKFLKQGLAISSGNFTSWILLAKIYQMEDNRGLALSALEKAYKLNPLSLRMRYIWEAAKQETDIKKVPLDLVVSPPGTLD